MMRVPSLSHLQHPGFFRLFMQISKSLVDGRLVPECRHGGSSQRLERTQSLSIVSPSDLLIRNWPVAPFVLFFERQSVADGVLRPDDWTILVRKWQQIHRTRLPHPLHKILAGPDDDCWIATDPVQPSDQLFLPHLAQNDIPPARVRREAEKADHSRPR
jgi:hypothetical protein